MRVLHVVRGDHGHHVGGDVVQLESTVAALRDEGVDAFAATVADAPDQVDVVHLYNLQLPVALRRDHRAARARWPHATVALSPIQWPVELARYARARDRILLWRGVKSFLKQSAWWGPTRSIVASVDLVLPNSDIELDRLTRHYRLPADRRWVTIPNGADLSLWTPGRAAPAARATALTAHGLPADAPVVLACVGRVGEAKNQVALVEALDLVDGAVLLVVGPDEPGPFSAAFHAAAAARPGRVAHTGALAPPAIAELLRSVDVHVLASYRETPGLASIEAASVGCEVVVTRCGSAEEYFGDTAHVCEPHDVASIAAAIRHAVASPRQPATRERVAGLDWRAVGRALAAAYAEAAARR